MSEKKSWLSRILSEQSDDQPLRQHIARKKALRDCRLPDDLECLVSEQKSKSYVPDKKNEMDNERRLGLVGRMKLGAEYILETFDGRVRWVRCVRGKVEGVNDVVANDFALTDSEVDVFLCEEQVPKLEESLGLRSRPLPGFYKSCVLWLGGALLAALAMAGYSSYAIPDRRLKYQGNLSSLREGAGDELVEPDALVREIASSESVPVYVLMSVDRFRPDLSHDSGILPGVLSSSRRKYLEVAADLFHVYKQEAVSDGLWYEDDAQHDEVALGRMFFSHDQVLHARELAHRNVMDFDSAVHDIENTDGWDWALFEGKRAEYLRANSSNDEAAQQRIRDFFEVELKDRPFGTPEERARAVGRYYLERDTLSQGRWWANNLPNPEGVLYGVRLRNGLGE